MSDKCEHDVFSRPTSTISLRPMETERFVAVLEELNGSFRLETNLTRNEAKLYVCLSPAVFVRMPPCSYGVLDVYIRLRPNKPTKFGFDFKLSNASDLAYLDIDCILASGSAAAELVKGDKNVKLMSFWTESGGSYGVECPEGTGLVNYIDCDEGEHGACVDGMVKCVANDPD